MINGSHGRLKIMSQTLNMKISAWYDIYFFLECLRVYSIWCLLFSVSLSSSLSSGFLLSSSPVYVECFSVCKWSVLCCPKLNITISEVLHYGYKPHRFMILNFHFFICSVFFPQLLEQTFSAAYMKKWICISVLHKLSDLSWVWLDWLLS